MEIRLNSASVAVEVEVEAELGKKYGLLPYKGWGKYPQTKLFLFFSKGKKFGHLPKAVRGPLPNYYRKKHFIASK